MAAATITPCSKKDDTTTSITSNQTKVKQSDFIVGAQCVESKSMNTQPCVHQVSIDGGESKWTDGKEICKIYEDRKLLVPEHFQQYQTLTEADIDIGECTECDPCEHDQVSIRGRAPKAMEAAEIVALYEKHNLPVPSHFS